MRLKIWLCYSICILLTFPAIANTQFTQRKDVQAFIKNLARETHFSTTQLNQIMNQVVIQPQIIEKMDKPFEKKNWDIYRALFLTPARIQGGLEYWEANQNLLNKAQKQYGVPAEIVVAILGVETLYGTRQGGFRVLDALATLAFNYPKRSPYFTQELKQYLLLCREQKKDTTYFIGSYAGAIGQPQFMPSSYRNFSVDFNHNGKKDLVNEDADVIGSIANYFHRHGWKSHEAIAQPAHVSGTKYQHIHANPKSANYTYWHLLSAGIQPKDKYLFHPKKAGLIELVTEKGNEYWIAFPNFFVITRYNSSPQYALAVYLLSQQLKTQWTQRNSKRYRP